MIAGSVLVLTAVAVTGISIYQNNQPKQQEENIVDFSVLEDEQSNDSAQVQNSDVQNFTSNSDAGELDYDPYYAAQDELIYGNSSEAEIAKKDSGKKESGENAASDGEETVPQTGGEKTVGYAEFSDGTVVNQTEGDVSTVNGNSVDALTAEQKNETENTEEATDSESSEDAGSEQAAAESQALEAVANVMQEEMNLHFGESTALNWPIVGNVVLNYSMDKTVYFQTLQQYKYNPSIVIAATQGTDVACAAKGVVKSIYDDPQTGMTVVMNLGDGYELTYGQLTDICVEEGDLVETGVFIGKVAAPTKYYSKEGTNVYLKLTKDQEPVNPLDYLG